MRARAPISAAWPRPKKPIHIHAHHSARFCRVCDLLSSLRFLSRGPADRRFSPRLSATREARLSTTVTRMSRSGAALELTETRIWQVCRAAVGTPRLILVDNRRPPSPGSKQSQYSGLEVPQVRERRMPTHGAPPPAARRTNNIGLCWLNGGCAVPIIWSGRSKPPTHAPPKCGDQALSSMAWSNNFPPGARLGNGKACGELIPRRNSAWRMG